jgi:hypothetical protein
MNARMMGDPHRRAAGGLGLRAGIQTCLGFRHSGRHFTRGGQPEAPVSSVLTTHNFPERQAPHLCHRQVNRDSERPQAMHLGHVRI